VHDRRRLGEALLATGQPDRGLAELDRVRREAPALGLIRVAALANARVAQDAAVPAQMALSSPAHGTTG
jgi:hypothetical protein